MNPDPKCPECGLTHLRAPDGRCLAATQLALAARRQRLSEPFRPMDPEIALREEESNRMNVERAFHFEKQATEAEDKINAMLASGAARDGDGRSLGEWQEVRESAAMRGLRFRSQVPPGYRPKSQAAIDHARQAVAPIMNADNSSVALGGLPLERERFWNHRDSARFSDSALTKGVLFRGSSPHRYAADKDYREWLKSAGIAVRIDLRGEREKYEYPISDLGFRTVEVPIDPRNDFRPDDPLRDGVSPMEASYRFTAFRCTRALKAVVDEVARGDGAVFVHCYAGEDRTGVIIALAQLFAGAKSSRVLTGYSASSDIERTTMFIRVLALVEATGGVEALARIAYLDPSTVARFRKRMVAR